VWNISLPPWQADLDVLTIFTLTTLLVFVYLNAHVCRTHTEITQHGSVLMSVQAVALMAHFLTIIQWCVCQCARSILTIMHNHTVADVYFYVWQPLLLTQEVFQIIRLGNVYRLAHPSLIITQITQLVDVSSIAPIIHSHSQTILPVGAWVSVLHHLIYMEIQKQEDVC
jgi:hypothetical protein